MIHSKQDLKEYLAADKFAMARSEKRPMFYDYGWRYLVILRKLEYAINCKTGFLGRMLVQWRKLQLHQMGIKCCGYLIPPNVCGKGLSVSHLGSVIINEGTTLGEYCRIHMCVSIGTRAGRANDAATVGNRVYIGPGARIFGPVVIADDIAIGANAVVTKSFTQPGITIAGVPAKKVADSGSRGLLLAPGINEVIPKRE